MTAEEPWEAEYIASLPTSKLAEEVSVEVAIAYLNGEMGDLELVFARENTDETATNNQTLQ